MAITTLSTDKWIETASVITSIETDLWYFQLTPIPATVLETDLWALSYTPGNLPVYNPSIMTAVARVYQNLPFPQFVIAGQGTGNIYQLFKKNDTQLFTVWRSPVYQIGVDFNILQITFNLTRNLDTGMSIIPKLYFDNQRISSVGTVITGNSYSNKFIKLISANFDNSVSGKHNFFLELQFQGSNLEGVALPVNIEIEEHDN